MHEYQPQPEALPEPVRPRIYVADLAAYNAGRLHGSWLDADQEIDVLHEQVQAMLRRSPEPGAEEYAVHDFENFGEFVPHEFEPLERLARIGRGISEHGPAFGAWAAHCAGDDELLDQFEDAFRGEWASLAAYTEELLDDLGATATLSGVPEWLQPYVQLNVEGLSRDLELGGDVWTAPAEGGVYVFDGTI
jgi:antirestriction protein